MAQAYWSSATLRRKSWLENFVENLTKVIKPLLVADKNSWVATKAEQAQRDSDEGRTTTLWHLVSQYRGKNRAKQRAAVALRDEEGKPIATREGKHAFWVKRCLQEFGGIGEHLPWPSFLALAQQLQGEVRALRDRHCVLDLEAVDQVHWEVELADALAGVYTFAGNIPLTSPSPPAAPGSNFFRGMVG